MNTETKHTSGPWAWQKFGKHYCLTGQWGMRPIILAIYKGGLSSLVNGLLVPLDPNHPDAALIASAPDMAAELANLRPTVARLSAAYSQQEKELATLRADKAELIEALQDCVDELASIHGEHHGKCIYNGPNTCPTWASINKALALLMSQPISVEKRHDNRPAIADWNRRHS